MSIKISIVSRTRGVPREVYEPQPGARPSGAPMQVPAGFLGIQCSDPPIRWVYELDGPIVPSGGGGGWQTVARDGQPDAIEHIGTEGRKLTVPILMNGWPARTVEPGCAMIDRLARVPGARTETPKIALSGPVPWPGRVWVISESPEWGSDEASVQWDTTATFRVVQRVTLTLAEYVPPSVVQEQNSVSPQAPTFTAL